MKETTLRGTHVEMGRKVGAQLRAAGEVLPAISAEQARYTESLIREISGGSRTCLTR